MSHQADEMKSGGGGAALATTTAGMRHDFEERMRLLCGALRKPQDAALQEYFARPDDPEVNTLSYSSSKQTFFSLVRTSDGSVSQRSCMVL